MAVAAPMAVAAIVSSVAAAGVGAYGAIESGHASAASANYQSQVAANNAIIAQQNANLASAAGNAQASNQQIRTAAQVGAIKSAQAASGLDINSGSDLDVQSSAKMLGELDALTIRNNAARQAYGYQTQATSEQAQSGLQQAKAAGDITAGTIGGGGSILGGASSVANKWAMYQTVGVPGFVTGGTQPSPLAVDDGTF